MLMVFYLTIPFISSYEPFFSHTLSSYRYRITIFLPTSYAFSLKTIVRSLTFFTKLKTIKAYTFTTPRIKDKQRTGCVFWSISSIKPSLPTTVFSRSL